MVCGYSPEKRHFREGPHTGTTTWALEKLTLLSRRRSMFGVFALGCSGGCRTQSLRSSQMINNTFGLAIGTSEAWTKKLQANAAMPRPKDFRNVLLPMLYLVCRICQFLLPTIRMSVSARRAEYTQFSGSAFISFGVQVPIAAGPAMPGLCFVLGDFYLFHLVHHRKRPGVFLL